MALSAMAYAMERWWVRTLVLPKVMRSEVLNVEPDSGQDAGIDHSLWDQLLKAHVARGTLDSIDLNVVDYHALAADSRLAEYREILAKADTTNLGTNELLALYINAYNCLCVGLIIEWLESKGTLPTSINDLSNQDGRKLAVWDRPAGIVAGKAVTLNDVEHRILRARWREPRVHACIVCASISCPDLRAEAFRSSRINAQMDEQCRLWMGSSKKGLFLPGSPQGPLVLSRIFLWFEADFLAQSPSVAAWALQYVDEAHPRARKTPRFNLRFFDYNWNLNGTLVKKA